MVVYKITDRIPLKIGDATFWVAPLSWADRSELLSCYQTKSGEETHEPLKIGMLTLKMSIKEVDGVQYSDGTEFGCELDDRGRLTDDCVSELCQLDCVDKLVTVCSKLAMNGPAKMDLDGVEINFSNVKSAKKKQSALTVAS